MSFRLSIFHFIGRVLQKGSWLFALFPILPLNNGEFRELIKIIFPWRIARNHHRSKSFFLGELRETVIGQNQNHFFLGSVVKLLPVKNTVSPGEIHIVLTGPSLRAHGARNFGQGCIKKSLYLTIPLCLNKIKGKEGAKNEVGITK